MRRDLIIGHRELKRDVSVWSFALQLLFLVGAVVGPARSPAAGEVVTTLAREGLSHGFLVVRSMEGVALASGEYTETTRGDEVRLRIAFRFKDGSVDDERVVFTQRGHFRLLTDRHEQSGPRFPHPYLMTIDAAKGEVKVRTGAAEEVYHLDLPEDLANGMIFTLVKNFRPGATEMKMSLVVLAPKPRVVTLAVSPEGEDTFHVSGAAYRATRYALKAELGGVLGMVAPVLGKEPKVNHVWVSKGIAPAIVRIEAQTYEGGPMWRIELASPVWR